MMDDGLWIMDDGDDDDDDDGGGDDDDDDNGDDGDGDDDDDDDNDGNDDNDDNDDNGDHHDDDVVHQHGPTIASPRFPARSLSDVQETAQYLAGAQLPTNLVSALVSKSGIDGKADVLSLVNLTPYDGWVEKTCKKGIADWKFKTLSVSKSWTCAQYVEKSLALELLEDFTSDKISTVYASTKLTTPASNCCFLAEASNFKYMTSQVKLVTLK